MYTSAILKCQGRREVGSSVETRLLQDIRTMGSVGAMLLHKHDIILAKETKRREGQAASYQIRTLLSC